MLPRAAQQQRYAPFSLLASTVECLVGQKQSVCPHVIIIYCIYNQTPLSLSKVPCGTSHMRVTQYVLVAAGRLRARSGSAGEAPGGHFPRQQRFSCKGPCSSPCSRSASGSLPPALQHTLRLINLTPTWCHLQACIFSMTQPASSIMARYSNISSYLMLPCCDVGCQRAAE